MQTNVKCLDIAYRNSRYDMLDRTGSDLSAIAMNGKRSVKSFPARVISRTPAASLRARMREPEGGALAGEGRHGSMTPKPGRVRSCNDMGV